MIKVKVYQPTKEDPSKNSLLHVHKCPDRATAEAVAFALRAFPRKSYPNYVWDHDKQGCVSNGLQSVKFGYKTTID